MCTVLFSAKNNQSRTNALCALCECAVPIHRIKLHQLTKRTTSSTTWGKHLFVERKKERNYFNVHEAKNSLWDRLPLHLLDVFGLFSVKLQNKCSKLLDKPSLNRLFQELAASISA